jgi:hypothetical protein
MRRYQRLRLVALSLVLLPCAWLSASPSLLPTPAKNQVAQPIEAAFAKIRPGMTEAELLQLMAPFQKVHTGHGQWPCWTDGRFKVYLTLDIAGFLFEGTQIRVLEGNLYRKQVVGEETHWIRVRGLAGG